MLHPRFLIAAKSLPKVGYAEMPFSADRSARVVGMNDLGDLVGTATIPGVNHSVAFMATVPEPTSAALLSLVVPVLVVLRRRDHLRRTLGFA